MQSKVQILEEKTKEAERTAELAEADAKEKDKELVETLKRLKDYESVCIFILSVKEFRVFLDTVTLFYAIYCIPFKSIPEISYDKDYPNQFILNYSNFCIAFTFWQENCFETICQIISFGEAAGLGSL